MWLVLLCDGLAKLSLKAIMRKKFMAVNSCDDLVLEQGFLVDNGW